MEAILTLYAQAYDPERPMVCFDEKMTQLLAHVREPLPLKSRHSRREDYEYKRQGRAICSCLSNLKRDGGRF